MCSTDSRVSLLYSELMYAVVTLSPGSLNCAAFVAGIIEGFLNGTDFVSCTITHPHNIGILLPQAGHLIKPSPSLSKSIQPVVWLFFQEKIATQLILIMKGRGGLPVEK